MESSSFLNLSLTMIRCTAAGVLLIASFLKYQAGPIDGLGLSLHNLLISMEMLLAVVLLSGLGGWVLIRFASISFAGFACVAAYKGLVGVNSCSCFGRIVVPPWITFVLDVVLAAALWAVSRRSPKIDHWRVRAICSGIAAIVAVAIIWWPSSSLVAADNSVPSPIGTISGKLIIIEPEQWVGKVFPLAAVLPTHPELMTGQWVVLVHHDGCSTCELALPRYKYAIQWGNAGLPRIALLAIPPEPAGRDFSWTQVRATLPAQWDWFATTPVVVGLQDGRVVRAASGEAAADADAFIDGLRHLTTSR